MFSTAARRHVAISELPGARCDEGPVRFLERRPIPAAGSVEASVAVGVRFESRQALYLDTETTGLSATAGTLPFLIGYGWYEDREFVIEQLLLRGPREERFALNRLAERLQTKAAVVTFNGRSLDLPLLNKRYELNGLPSPLSGMPHVDLLGPSRKMFGARMWSSRLVSLEVGVLGIRRSHDVMGQLIPELYGAYLQSGDAGPLAEVVDHNREDVVAMPRLLAVLARKVAQPLEEAHAAEELVAIGRMHLASGDRVLGTACLKRALEVATIPGTRRKALCALAQALRRSCDTLALGALWRRVALEFPGENRGYEELAKHSERLAS